MPLYTNETDHCQMVHFGHGDLVVSTSNDLTEVVITPSDNAGEIGGRTEQYDGKATDTIPSGVRMVFDRPESIIVLIDALQKVHRHLSQAEAQEI